MGLTMDLGFRIQGFGQNSGFCSGGSQNKDYCILVFFSGFPPYVMETAIFDPDRTKPALQLRLGLGFEVQRLGFWASYSQAISYSLLQ